MEGDFEARFRGAFNQEDKELCITLVQSALQSKTIGLIDLYTKILAPALNEIACTSDDFLCIWHEHIKTGIIRTILEFCYPWVLKLREEMKFEKTEKTIMVFCPPDEYHELGARMAADFFTVVGFRVIYVGNNTPRKSYLSAIEKIQPAFVAISISNPYHLFQTREVIQQIRNSCPSSLKIIVGGQAFRKNPDAYKEIGADLCIQSFDQIVAFRRDQA